MAPIRPKATAHHRARLARIADPTIRPKAHRAEAVVPDDFLSSKRDKRQIKHSAFVSKITTSSRSSSGVKKRRRPSKKLVTNLESLADALLELEDGENGEKLQDGKIRHKSLKHKPGALKRREKLVRGEMGRFRGNLAQLAAVKEDLVKAEGEGSMEVDGTEREAEGEEAKPKAVAKTATTKRWAMLRGYIESTMEQNPAFVGKG